MEPRVVRFVHNVYVPEHITSHIIMFFGYIFAQVLENYCLGFNCHVQLVVIFKLHFN